MKSIIYIFSLLIIFSVGNLQAQVAPPSSVDVHLEPIGTISTSLFDTTTLDMSTQSMKVKAIVDVVDHTNINKIHLKFGTTLGGSDLASHVFTNSPIQSVPLGWSFELANNKYELVIGDFLGLSAYHCEVKLEYNDGQISAPVTYSSQ